MPLRFICNISATCVIVNRGLSDKSSTIDFGVPFSVLFSVVFSVVSAAPSCLPEFSAFISVGKDILTV
mgnify:CR=1 FL=1